jgi:hypothetical protein
MRDSHIYDLSKELKIENVCRRKKEKKRKEFKNVEADMK